MSHIKQRPDFNERYAEMKEVFPFDLEIMLSCDEQVARIKRALENRKWVQNGIYLTDYAGLHVDQGNIYEFFESFGQEEPLLVHAAKKSDLTQSRLLFA